jgi:hypothetical protein
VNVQPLEELAARGDVGQGLWPQSDVAKERCSTQKNDEHIFYRKQVMQYFCTEKDKLFSFIQIAKVGRFKGRADFVKN